MKLLSERTLCVVLALVIALSAAGKEKEKTAYQLDFLVLKVNASITDNGLCSQTLPGLPGSFQVLHEKWYLPPERASDEAEASQCWVNVVMDGKTLTWNGEPKPDASIVTVLSKPSLATLEGERGAIVIGEESPSQYMERRQDGLFELKEIDERELVGLKLVTTLHEDSEQPDVVKADFEFAYSVIQDRKPIEGVALNIGKPVLKRASAQGIIGMRLEEWSCYRSTLDGQGTFYVFMRCKRL